MANYNKSTENAVSKSTQADAVRRDNANAAPAISTGTIIRTALLVLALLNQVLVIAGKSPLPVTDEQLAQLISLVATIGTALLAWWHNNSFTANARKADAYLHDLDEADALYKQYLADSAADAVRTTDSKNQDL